MVVKDLITLLKTLDQKAVIDMSSDEEGNSYGDISNSLSEGTLINGRKVYTIYPEGQDMAEDRYKF